MKSTMALNFYYARIGKPVEITCSCTKCENKNCLGMGQDIACESCSCEDCAEPMTCLLYDKTNKHSVGCGTKAPANSDGYENKFKTCFDGKSRLESPGYVFELPKSSNTCRDVSAKNKSESSGCVFELPKPAKNKFDSLGCMLALPKKITKQNDCASNNYTNGNKKESPKKTYELAKCIEKPHEQKTRNDCCPISALSKYKSPAYVLEPPKHSPKHNEDKKTNENELAGIVYELTNCRHKNCRKCNGSAKNKSEPVVCMTALPKQSPEHSNYECNKCKPINKNEHECDKCKPISKNEHECDKCRPISKNEYEHMKCKIAQIISHGCCHAPANDIARYVLDLRKKTSEQSDSVSHKFTKSNDYESLRNVHEPTKCTQKPQSQKKCHDCSHTHKPPVRKNSCSCSESANDKYKSHAHMEPNSQAQAKTKSGLAGCVLGPPIYSPKHNGHDCNKCKNRYEQNKYIQSRKNTEDCCHDSEKNDLSKYLLDLGKKSSELSDSECPKCTKRIEHQTLRNEYEPTKFTQKPQSQKNSHECCHYSAKHNSKPCTHKLQTQKTSYRCFQDSEKTKSESLECILELPKCKSTTTCSLEYCPKSKQENRCCRCVKTPTISQLTTSTSTSSQCLKCKRSTSHVGGYGSMSETRIPSYEPEMKEGSKISSPDEMYAIMTDTLKKQESVVETQKEAYLPTLIKKYAPVNRESTSPTAVYATIADKKQNNVVETLKSAYLPQNSLTWNPKCMPKNKCTCKQNHRTDQTKEIKKLSSHILCKKAQALGFAKHSCKEPHTRTSKSCTCEKRMTASGIMTGIRELQPPVTESLSNDYLKTCTESGLIKKHVAEKCPCKQNHTKERNKIIDPNENLQIYRCTNQTTHNAYRNNQRSLNHLHGVAACVSELPNEVSKKWQKLDIKQQRSKENQIEIQYFSNSRPSCNSEKAIAATTSNGFCTSLSNTSPCNMLSDVSKTSSSSKTKTAQGSEKNINPMNINRLETKRFTSETMHIFYNRNSSKCNVLTKNKYESPSYSIKSQQYTPTKNAQELFKNILQTHGDEIETLINKYQKKCGECSTLTKYEESESSGYLNDLPLSSLISITQSLCRESARSNSKSSGCLPKQQTYRTSAHESARNTKAFSINRLETKTMPFFECKDSAKQRSVSSGHENGSCKAQKKHENKNGYVFELPKYLHNSSTPKNSCKCNESAKTKFKSSRHMFELPKHDRHQKKKCDCSEFAKNVYDKPGCGNKISSELPGYVFELPKKISKHRSCSSTKLAKKSSKCHHQASHDSEVLSRCSFSPLGKKTSKCHHQAINDSEVLCRSSSTHLGKISSICRHKAVNDSEVLGRSSSSPLGKKLSKCHHQAINDSEVLCGSSSTQLGKLSSICRHKAVKNAEGLNSSSFTKLAKKLSKCHHQAVNDSDLLISSSSAKLVKNSPKCRDKAPIYSEVLSCCSPTKLTKKSSKYRHKAANNSDILHILKLVSKSTQSDTQNICKNAIGTQTNIIENLDLQNPASENTIGLCKDILKTQIHTIEVLKKIYFPQKSSANSILKLESSKNTCTPLQSSTEQTYNTKNGTPQPETANLSAELFKDISFTELNDSLACRKPKMSIKPKTISKYDILKKLKEAYKACSCKICECVATKTVKPDVCKCKPCECVECTSSFLSHEINDRQICDCKPCDCVQCTKQLAEQFNKHSNQCCIGKTRNVHHCQTLVVAPVEIEIEDNVPNVACNCSPCACIECGLVYPLGSSLINEMSTSTNRHALCRCEICLNENCDQSSFDSCRCQKRKVMSKPVENDTHDYDIRTAMIVHSKPKFQRVVTNDPIAMFAAVPNSHPSLENRQSKSQTCNCKECECISCVSQKEPINATKYSKFLSYKARTNSDFNDHTDNCEFKMSCECQIYKKIQSHDHVCETCSSLNSETRSLKYSPDKPKNLYRFERHQYSDDTCMPPKSVLLPFKKGDVLTPSTHKLKVQHLIKQGKHLEPRSKPKATTNPDSSSKQQDFDICHALSTSNKISSITQANLYVNDFKSRYTDKRKTLKYDAYMYCQEINKRKSSYKNIAMVQNDISGNSFSDHSSFLYKDSCSNTKITRSNNKSMVSSFHSSGHNCPDYLIQIQKGTIEKNLKDIMKLDKDETIKLNKCSIIPTSIEKHNVDKISFKNMSVNDDNLKTNHYENAVITSFQSNYKFGLRNNFHVQLSNENDKQENCESNGIQNKERDQLQLSAYLTSSQYSVKINNENCESFNAINDFNEFHVAHKVFDYNVSARHSVTVHDEHSGLVRSTEILNANDYKRVTNTLNEAREFSLELIRLLKTYEKANNEFESISEKLKLSHGCLLNSKKINY